MPISCCLVYQDERPTSFCCCNGRLGCFQFRLRVVSSSNLSANWRPLGSWRSFWKPWCLIMIFGETDNEQQAEWRLPNYGCVDECCGYCFKDRSSVFMAHTNLRRDSVWRQTQFMSNIQFVGRLVKRHPIHRGYHWNVQSPRLDIMNTLEHHGQSSIIIASTAHHVISHHAISHYGGAA